MDKSKAYGGLALRIAVGIMVLGLLMICSASSIENSNSLTELNYSNAPIYSADKTLTDYQMSVFSPFSADIAHTNGLPDIPHGLDTFHVSGMLETSGTYFEIKNSSYLNITLSSSEPINLTLESIPEMVTMRIESTTSAASTNIIFGGFLPHTTYHKYEDDYHNHTAFTTDSNGKYTYLQDLSGKHLVFIQPRPSTRFINANGGDCASIGTWNSGTKTCTLTTDLSETIQIDSDGITLNGNAHTITGSYTGNGVYLSSRTRVTIKNLNVKQFTYGIFLSYSSNNTLTGNNASNNNYGIWLSDSSNKNTLSGNNASNNLYYGMWLSESTNNTLSGNNASNNLYDGIFLFYSNNNTLRSNNASNNHDSGLSLYSSNNNTLSGNNASNNDYGINLGSSNNNTLISSNASGNGNSGIFLGSSNDNTLSRNDASNNGNGIWLSDSSSKNTLSGNNANSNNENGIHLEYSSNSNALICNNASNNNYGIWLSDSSKNMLNSNDASNNGYGITLSSSSNNNTLNSNNANSNIGYHGSGIFLGSSSNNTLSGNNASNNGGYNGGHGIYLSSSSNNNTLSENNANLNNLDGIVLYSSSNNKIYNNIFNNTNNIWIYNSNINTWNMTKTPGTNIIGGPYLGGNFWANPNGNGFSQTCPDGNGICSSIYTLDATNTDFLPLKKQLTGTISGTVRRG